MKCENCGASMELNPDRGCFVCPYCASEWVPDINFEGVRVLEPSDCKCPLCKSPLGKARLLDHSLLYCQSCQGMLIPMGDLNPLAADLRASRNAPPYVSKPLNPRDLDRQIACPECSQPMDTHPYMGPGNVIVDSCENCAVVWLDHGEIYRIAMAPDHDFAA